jgi:pimeloyl-ACP methyl ester carboxylesterase
MEIIADPGLREGTTRLLVVMLPGVNDEPESFRRHGLMADLVVRHPWIDCIAVGAQQDLYLDGTLTERLHEEVIVPACERGYRRIWMAGASLGAMGSLLYAQAYPGVLEGLILLAPYLGASGTIAAILRAGGLVSWQPPIGLPADDERALLAWIRAQHPSESANPLVFLGYGLADRFRDHSVLLAPLLLPSRVVTDPGGHDWATWAKLWSGILARRPFPRVPPGMAILDESC